MADKNTDFNRRQEDKEQGRFEGKVLQKLDDLQIGQNEIKDVHKDIYKRINKNSNAIANQKGWMAAIAWIAGMFGGFIKGVIFKQ